MLRFWLRELMGWLLVLLGGYLLVVFVALLLDERNREFTLDAPFVCVVGIVLFRGGIHLLKVAVAARICLHTQAEAAKPAAPVRVARRTDYPLDE